MIVSKEELLLKAHGVPAFEYSSAKIDIILDQTVDEFLDCFSQKGESLFYCYSYLSKSAVVIDGNALSRADAETRQLLKKLCPHLEDLDWYLDDIIDGVSHEEDPGLADYTKQFTRFEVNLCQEILAYNNTIDRSKLDRPVKLEIFMILQGKLIGVCEEDEWYLYDESIRPASQALLEILESHQDEAMAAEQELREKRKAVEKRLTDYLKSCPQFLSRKNQGMRRDFAMDLWNDPEFADLHEVFSGPYGPTQSYFNLFDMVYNEIKEAKKNR